MKANSIKPILFSTPMVQAIINGTKTQTRRIVKGEPLKWLEDSGFTPEFVADPGNSLCPYGQIGGVLWVRETSFETSSGYFLYKADEQGGAIPLGVDEDDHVVWEPIKNYKWKPSIFMPKEACRLFLKITDIRVERLDDISEHDALKEGIERRDFHGDEEFKDYRSNNDGLLFKNGGDDTYYLNPRDSFISLWQSINGEQSWNDNPFVWVLEFERCDKPENFIV